MSSEEHGNLFISDIGKKCIYVFSKSGMHKISGGDKLQWPLSVCVSGQYVYVADNSNHNVSIFTTEGEHCSIKLDKVNTRHESMTE